MFDRYVQVSSTKRSRIQRICRRWPVSRLALFGSRARGTARRSSDYDLVVDFQKHYAPTLFDLGELQSELAEALEAPVDLLTSGAAQDILKNAQVLFERN